jgi:phosphoribosyl-ATP pyrophosphohydrolase/phosphoribosyl-AMP cyclohydrolase
VTAAGEGVNDIGFDPTGARVTEPAGDHVEGGIEWLWDIIQGRARERPPGSYVVKLLDQGTDRIARKIGEEAAEVIIAAKNRSAAEMSNELADLWFHSLLILQDAGLAPPDVFRVLAARHRRS